MEEVWRRIEMWLKANAPEILEKLEKGAPAKALAAAEKKLGVRLPEDFKASYRIHDGQSGIAIPLMGEWRLLRLDYLLKKWQMMRTLVEGGDFADYECKALGPVRPEWFNLKWIPIADNGGGDYWCVDLDPPAKGKLGQIITFWHTASKRERIADSFEQLLSHFADDLERKRYVFKNEEMVKKGG